MKHQISNRVITQMVLIACLVILVLVITNQLSYFLSGALGAVTLYLIFRSWYNKLTIRYRWHKALASLFFIMSSIVVVVLPFVFLGNYFLPKLIGFVTNTDQIIQTFNKVKDFAAHQPILKRFDFSDKALLEWLQKLSTYIPGILNSVTEAIVNLAIAFFILYFMQVNGKEMENKIRNYLPLSEESKNELWRETNLMVKSNAIGIPVLALCQGLVAIVGYLIFGVNNAVLWGLLTGAATIIPVVGTMIVWVPICIIMLASGETYTVLGLVLYNFILVGSTDNILRFTIMKSIGNVHPLLTVFGVILGLNLFGVMGLIFGPLILSYVGVLIHIYRSEFGTRTLKPVEELGEIKKETPDEEETS